MNLATRAVILLCGIYICEAGYGYGDPPPPPQETQSDVQAPAYVPPYAKNSQYTKTGRSGYGTKTYSGSKTYSGTKTGYGGTKTAYSGTKTGYSGTKTAYGEKTSWHSQSGNAPSYEEFNHNANQPYTAKCEPDCKNNGICVDTNTCHCPPNYKGQYCELVSKPCLSYPPLPSNSLRRCSADYCTITCFQGYKFAGLGTTAANLVCNADGTWQPTTPLLAAIPDCEPQCNPPCLNGGVCLAVDTCQCPAEYRGSQCQYSTSVCDVRKLAFNGGYSCFGDGDSFSCTLSCPAGVAFSSPPADAYKCTYETGVFQPQPIPHCVYNEGFVVQSHHRNKSYVENYSHSSQRPGFEQQAGGFEQQSGGFEQQSGGLDQQSGGFEQQSGGFEQQGGGFEQQSGGFEQHSGGFEQQSGFDQTGFTQKPMKIVVQDISPKGGVCLTWAGTHYKTFDGKIYSFQSPCQHILLRERREHKYTVAIQQQECKRHAYCPSELTIYLEDKPYFLSVGEDGAVIFRSTKRLLPIPAELPGIRVALYSEYVVASLDGAGVTVKWDTNNIVIIEGTVQVWNNTEGLCGTLDGLQDDDFLTKDGTIAPTQAVFEASWQMNKIGDVCSNNPTETSACSSKSAEELRKAQLFCSSIFSRDKFRRCSRIMDVSQLLDTCQWDYCACAASLSPEECACTTVSVYAKECLRNGVEDMKTWRDAETCPMKCPEGKIYKACGPDSQPSCAFPSIATIDNSTCVEGCFCPEGTLMEGRRCIPKSECPCRLRNKVFKPGKVVPKECNTCVCEAGEWKCTQASCGARCSAMGDPHYTTFDGTRFDFMGRCSYDMLRTGNVTIQAENVACSGAISEAMNLAPYKGAGKPSCTKAVNVKYNDVNIHLKQGGYILVNGQDISSLPVMAGDVRIRAASSLFLIVQLPNKIDVWWDGHTRVYIDVPPEFHEKTKGLCGTFNLNQKDDFLTPEGDVEQSVYAFANKWKTREFCEDVDMQEPEHPCKANVENKEAAEKYCSKLKSKLFEECHWYVDVEPYYLDCVYDMCACADDVARCLCPVLGDYAMACAERGVKIQWRYNVKECEPSCGQGQEYTVCANSCLRTCADVAVESSGVCKPVCVEGCACPDGQVLDDSNRCVPVGMCPCFHKGVKFDAGYKECRPGRRERELCTCVGARWECAPATDADIQKYPPAEDLKTSCSAADHMEFTACQTAEPLTCKNMHLPPPGLETECRPGCQCKQGFVLDTASKKCVRASECPCHHGGRSYADGEAMREECNTCECKNGQWSCTTKKCAGVCTAWGDSHVITFDGNEYDFEGVCTYLLAKGALDGSDGFSVEIQNVPCGTTGATCSKSVTLKVGSGDNEETVTLNKDAPLPDLSKLKGIKRRVVGEYVFLDVPRLGMSLQWDQEMRVYVKVDAMWQGRLKGLCGNYNGDMRDDYQTPGGGIPESSALIFVDSWKLKSTCPKAQPVTEHCKERPSREAFATATCGALKRYPFSLCHAEAPPSGWVARCERDACACDAGGDCVCACAALAAYAQLCAARGVPFKWRTQKLCPMQCDEECSTYDDCLSSCPLETCDNTVDYAEIKAVCEQDACVEGCKPKKSCPEGSVYTNSTFTECVPRAQCRRVCMTLPGGKEFLEGEITEEDACHTCRCSKKHNVCTGQPCPSALPLISTVAPTEEPHKDESLKCVTGWTAWLNRGHPQTGPSGESVDNEPLPKPNELQIGSPMCQPAMMTEIECRTTVNHMSAKDTGLDAECSLERGLVCKEKGNVCPDFEIRVYCQCEEGREESPMSKAIRPEPTPEPFQCLNADHPNYPHPTDCAKFYECTPDQLNLGKKHAVLKSCGEGLMYNPKLMICDWPASVVAVRPECGSTAKPTEPATSTEPFTKAVPLTKAPVEVTTPGRCPPGQVYSDCAFPCDKLCHHFKRTMLDKKRCLGFEKCVEGCVSATCEPGWLWRDERSCVPAKDCTCSSNKDGTVVKPNGVVVDGCIKCQCLENDMHCDTSDCGSSAPTVTPPPTMPIPTTVAPLIVKNTATPPPECSPQGYKNLLWEDEPLPANAFDASSVANELFEPQFAQIDAHPIDNNAGSWSPAVQDEQQFIQVTLPRREPVHGVILQGSPLFDQYVTSYQLLYGDDPHAFSVVEGEDGKPKVFRGPVDHNNPMKQMIEPPIEARVVRIRPLTWHDSIAVRFELIGCQEPSTTTYKPSITTPEPLQCTEPLGLAAELPVESIEVSSNNDLRRYFALDGDRGWKPAYSTPGEWIMFDFTSPRNITGIKTKGGPSGWVTSYNIMYTSDLSTFNPVLDNTGSNRLFPANFDEHSEVFNEFKPPLHARYLKVLPLKWKKAIEMRVEPIGCFEPYPVTQTIAFETAPSEVAPCSLCPGVHSAAACLCSAPPLTYYDGENCVSRDQCPCVEGYMTYAVGSTFRGDNCDECVCKLGGITDCKPVKECLCAPNLVPKLINSTCECTCSPCPNGARICPTSKLCLPLSKWCDGLQDCPDDERDCTPKEPLVLTTEPPAVSTVAATLAAVQTPPTTTTAKRKLCLPLSKWCDGLQDCPDDEKDCAPKEALVLTTEPLAVSTVTATLAAVQTPPTTTTAKRKLCLPLSKWCVGLQDCPDDERDCTPKEPLVLTTEPPVVSTVAATLAEVQTPPTTTTAKHDERDCTPKEPLVLTTEPPAVSTVAATLAAVQTPPTTTTAKRKLCLPLSKWCDGLQDCPDDEKDCAPKESLALTTELLAVSTVAATLAAVQTPPTTTTAKRKLCLPLSKWCDGLQDCPDDERDCTPKEPLVLTTEPPVVSTVAATLAAVQTPPTTTTAKRKLCLPLSKWCDGLQDCPDDERDCTPKEPLVLTTEPPVVSTVAATLAAVQTPPTTTTAKPQECPKVECPPGYFVRLVSTSTSYSRSSSDLPPPRPRNSYSRYTKGGYRKGGYSGSKGGYSKGGFSKGGFSKGGYTPAPIYTTTHQPILNTPTDTTQECAQFKCIPNLPPPFKPGSTPPPMDCSPPICPPNYSLKLDSVALEPNQCPQYICVPPAERYAYCNMTGRTFNTFDGAEYKFDVCFHILARDARFNAWSVLVRKICSVDGCVNQLIVQQDDDIIVVKPNLMIQYNQYEYTVEQTSKICFQKNSFDVHKIGNGLAIKSKRYDFGVIYTTDGNVKVSVNTKYKSTVDGLCGFYDGDTTNERRKPDGAYAASIDEFAQGWAKPGLRPDACEIKIIPPEKQKRAWDLCDVILKEPISRCGQVLNLDKWRSICLEKICECTELVVNGSRRSDEECRCAFLEALVAQCLAGSDTDLADWRLQMDCPADCPAPLVHYDCYRRRCEPACSSIGDPRRTCPAEDGQCFPGCYCPPGKLRRGDSCVTPQDCLDCVCSGVGTPAKYVSFEGDDIPYLGNCTYLASRDRNETAQYKYEVYATNGPCEDQITATCTKAVHLVYEKNIVHVARNDITKKLIVTVNGVTVFKFPLSNEWVTVSQPNGKDIVLLLPEAHVEVKVLRSKMEFSVKVPSYLYANQTEGLCGVCAGYLEELVTSNGTVTEDFEEYGKSWQASPSVLETLGSPLQEQCGDIPPPPPCTPPPPAQNPCYNLLNADRFGACHALLDPQSYVDACSEELCASPSGDACPALERYAAECRRAGVCLSWREGLCPYPCVAPMVYESCMRCEETCENYEEVKSSPSCRTQQPVEGCFCPKGKVRVKNTCIEPSKCFPCDAEKKHFAGDEWQEDACTTCTCSRHAPEPARAACTVQACRSPLCAQNEDLLTKPPAPGACCPQYICVPVSSQAQCEEPKKMDCGFGQVLKQKTTPSGCTQFTCECKPASECEHIPTANEVDILEPGMERVIDESGCCPRALMLCKPESCPQPAPCAPHHAPRTHTLPGACCPLTVCEPPKDKCIVSLEWEATPMGGEKQRDKPQIVVKDIEETWVDGPCRYCSCARGALGPAARCATTDCAPIAATDQFVLEPRPVPFQCCPEPAYVACRDGDNIYRVGEKWTSKDNVCESYQCQETADGKLERVTSVQTCHTDCDVGWQYFPAEPESGKCCGKCKPVACVCEGEEHKIGERWTSPDLCTTYTCADTNGTIQVEMKKESCPEVSVEMQKEFVLEEKSVPGKCCKTHEPVACRDGDKIYQEGQTWPTADACKNLTCAREAGGRLAVKESVESCQRECRRGWAYESPPPGLCCGRCTQRACLVEDDLKEPGTTWYSADNCTTYSCEQDGDSVQMSTSRQTCPDISSCRPEDIVNETCCQVCKEKPADLSMCVPTPRVLEAGLVRVSAAAHGLCVNTEAVSGFKECRGSCSSGTLYNNKTGVHDSQCECCQTLEYEHLLVELICEDHSARQHQVATPRRCGCSPCGGGTFLPREDHTWPSQQEADEIPDMFQRFGTSRSPRKH